MVLTRRQAQILTNKLKNISINQLVKMANPVVNYMLSPFEGNTNTENPQGTKLYLQEKKEIDKESEKLDSPVSNTKDIIDNFTSLANKYDRGRLN